MERRHLRIELQILLIARGEHINWNPNMLGSTGEYRTHTTILEFYGLEETIIGLVFDIIASKTREDKEMCSRICDHINTTVFFLFVNNVIVNATLGIVLSSLDIMWS
jgi:hypothetical protein